MLHPGLKLQPARAPADVLVIDHAGKRPEIDIIQSCGKAPYVFVRFVVSYRRR